MQLILILSFSVLMGVSRYVLYLTCLSNELTLAVSGVTDATSRLPSIPVLTSSSSFPVPRLWHLIHQSLCCKGNLNKFNPFSDSQGRIWMDLTLELFSSCCCHAGFQRSTLSSAGLAGSGPLVKACHVFGGEDRNGEVLHFGHWTWRQKISTQSKSCTKCHCVGSC